jgi:hypothetical protein
MLTYIFACVTRRNSYTNHPDDRMTPVAAYGIQPTRLKAKVNESQVDTASQANPGKFPISLIGL